MLRHLSTALRFTIVTGVLFGLIYPLAVTGAARAFFAHQADGSMVERGGTVVGSAMVGQLWTRPQYFQGRPSAAGTKGYDPTATGGTNLAPTSKKLIAATAAAIAALRRENPDARGPIPMDLVTSSASGIDPDISPEGAYYQAPRVARARNMALDAVDGLIAAQIHGRTLGFMGEPTVNVLALNLALDAASAPR